jgi:hypothetical protein
MKYKEKRNYLFQKFLSGDEIVSYFLWLTEKKQFPDHFGGNDITIIKIRE